MMLKVRLQQVEEGTFLALPENVLAHLRVVEGDTVLVLMLESGVIQISKPSAEFKRQMEVADDLIDRYRNTLKALRDAGD
jgi:hypothetical protein